jgi:hypothetical protein
MLRHQVDVQRWIGEVAACPGNWGFCGDKPGAWNAAFKIWLRPSKMHMLVRGSRCSWAEHASLGVDEVADFLHMCTNVWDEGQKQLLGFYVANSRAKSSSTNEHTLWYDGGNPPPGAVGGYRGAERGAKVGGVLGSGLTKLVVSGITLDVHATSLRNRTRQGRCSPRKSGSGPREAVVATPNIPGPTAPGATVHDTVGYRAAFHYNTSLRSHTHIHYIDSRHRCWGSRGLHTQLAPPPSEGEAVPLLCALLADKRAAARLQSLRHAHVQSRRHGGTNSAVQQGFGGRHSGLPWPRARSARRAPPLTSSDAPLCF